MNNAYNLCELCHIVLSNKMNVMDIRSMHQIDCTPLAKHASGLKLYFQMI